MHSKKYVLYAELLILFIGLPLLFFLELYDIPRIPALLAATLYCIYILYRDPQFSLKKTFTNSFSLKDLKFILPRLLIIFPVILGFAFFLNGGEFLFLPRNKFWLWLALLILYPLFSALPQELLYRVFFFRRYGSIFKSDRARILASSLLFSYMHLIYDNYVAVIFTLAGGLLFSLSYARTRSLWIVSAEHAVYGILVFTVGLGRFFYDKL